MARTAWVERWTLDGWPVWDDGGTDLRQLDRFACRWEDEDRGRVGYGPACLPLDAALGWAGAAGDRTVVAAVDGRWDPHGDVRMPWLDEGWSVCWDHVPAQEWAVTVRLSLGPADFADVLDRRDDPFGDPVAAVLHVDPDEAACAVVAVVGVRAPTLELAADVGAHHLRRVLCEPGGLRGDLGELLAACVEAVRPVRPQRA